MYLLRSDNAVTSVEMKLRSDICKYVVVPLQVTDIQFTNIRELTDKVNLSIASTPPFLQLTLSDNVANFIRKLLVLHVQTCSNAVLSS
jgi:hypothetical protein